MNDLAFALNRIMPELLARPALSFALAQRAKFEGWLKIELSYALSSDGSAVTLEEEYGGYSGKYRADLAVTLHGARHYIMLKTVNTNFRLAGVETRHRPITKNIDGVVQDIKKLQCCSRETFPYVLFVVFPVRSDSHEQFKQVGEYLLRIEQAGAKYIGHGIVPRSDTWGVAWYLARVAPASVTVVDSEELL